MGRPRVWRRSFPEAGAEFVEEEAGDFGGCGFGEFEFGGEDVGVVDDEEVGGLEVVGEVVEVFVVDGVGRFFVDEEAGVVARGGGVGGDEGGGGGGSRDRTSAWGGSAVDRCFGTVMPGNDSAAGGGVAFGRTSL